MTDRNYRVRFAENNFAKLITSSIAYSSELAAFPFSNAINSFRSRTWKPSGNFTITDANKTIYINDGADKSVDIATGDYATPSLLAAEIESKLLSISSSWSCSYDTSATYSFTFGTGEAYTLRLSETTTAIWDTIGFTGPSDISQAGGGIGFTADQQRNHTDERVTFDLGYNATIDFFAMIGPLDEVFSVSNNATITLSGSNLNEWDSPPLVVTIDPTDKGAMKFIDNEPDTGYRFWRLSIIDRENTLGPTGLSIGYIYLGDYITMTTRNISSGFTIEDADPSEIFESESGVLHFDVKTKYSRIDGLELGLLPKVDKDKLRLMFEVLGTTTPFFISLDPALCVTDTLSELTKYVVFDGPPSFTHIVGEIFSMSLRLREVI